MPRKKTQTSDTTNETSSNDGSPKMTEYSVQDPNPASETQGETVAVPAEDDTTTSDAVGGPEVVTADSVSSDETDAPAAFDGTLSEEDRAQAQADDAETLRKRAEDSAAVAAAQRAADLKFAAENPHSPVARAANPDVGGESFI